MKNESLLCIVVIIISPPLLADEDCTLIDSPPIVVSEDGQVIENLRIRATSEPAIKVAGYSGVVIRDVQILHEDGGGIYLRDAPNTTIEDVDIENVGAPASGASATSEAMNIFCNRSSSLRVTRARLTRGSSGAYLNNCPDSELRYIEGHDFRGPYPRGQLVQWDESHRGLLEDFSVINSLDSSFPEDAINSYRSADTIIRRGLVKGVNAPRGAAIQFENYEQGGGGLVEDVDAVDVTNGFAAYNSMNRNITFRRVRVKNVLCSGAGGRQPPSSGGLYYVADDVMEDWAGPLMVIDSTHYPEPCHVLAWYAPSFDVLDSKLDDFVPRSPIENSFCWETATSTTTHPKPPGNVVAK